ncbi:MAG: sensor domain-containing diguanylate cyclase [Actinomycetota bacterium]
MEAPLPENEPDRVAALYRLRVLDQGPAPALDRLTRIAKNVFDVPIALVSLIDANRQWFASRQGLEVTETPRCDAFCAHTILDPQTMVVNDARHDERFVDNPLVIGPPEMRFYAGAPITLQTGERVGTLCIIDRQPRELDETQLALLRDLADAVEREFQVSGLLLTDPLTGLANRLAAEDAGDRLLQLARRRLDPMSMLYIDLDDLHEINESRGHQAGDAHLMRVAEVLRTTLRKSDVVARIGSDEFMAVLPDVGADGAAVAANNVEYALAQASADHPDLPPLRASVGVTTFMGPESFGELLDRAAREMYEVKAAKKDTDPRFASV